MTAEDYNAIADAADVCTMIIRRGEVIIAVSFDSTKFAAMMRSRAAESISVPTLAIPDGVM